MAKKDKKQSKIKVKKKMWCKILAPDTFGSRELGESYVSAPEVAVGRTLRVNLRELTGESRDQHTYVRFKITKVEGTTLHTESLGCELTPAYVKRVVRKNTDRVDDYFVIKTKDDKSVIIKSFLVTRFRGNAALRTEIRMRFRDMLAAEAKKFTYEGFVHAVASKKMLHGLKKKLSKLTPLKEAAVRAMLLASSRTKVGVTLEREANEPVTEEAAEPSTPAQEAPLEEVAHEEVEADEALADSEEQEEDKA